MMFHSPLKQRVFDELFSGLSLLYLLDAEEVEELAQGLEAPEASDRESAAMFKAVAAAVRMAKTPD
jgi:hypothetical protein